MKTGLPKLEQLNYSQAGKQPRTFDAWRDPIFSFWLPLKARRQESVEPKSKQWLEIRNHERTAAGRRRASLSNFSL
jgi:hypothetical protein